MTLRGKSDNENNSDREAAPPMNTTRTFDSSMTHKDLIWVIGKGGTVGGGTIWPSTNGWLQ
jgi:hypothetical protein